MPQSWPLKPFAPRSDAFRFTLCAVMEGRTRPTVLESATAAKPCHIRPLGTTLVNLNRDYYLRSMSLFQGLTDFLPTRAMASRNGKRRLMRRLWWHAYELAKPKGMMRAPVGNHRMWLDTADSIISWCLLKHGYFEPHETEVIESLLRPGDTFIDCGANV